MSLTVQGIHDFWAAQSSLTALIPASRFWLDIPGNTDAMPYAVLTTMGGPNIYSTSSPYISTTKFQISIYASTLASVAAVVAAVKTAFLWSAPTLSSFGKGCRLDNEIERGLVGGAYNAVLTFTLWEDATY